MSRVPPLQDRTIEDPALVRVIAFNLMVMPPAVRQRIGLDPHPRLGDPTSILSTPAALDSNPRLQDHLDRLIDGYFRGELDDPGDDLFGEECAKTRGGNASWRKKLEGIIDGWVAWMVEKVG